MSKIAPDSEMPSANICELTAGELGAIAGGTILQVNGGGNSPPPDAGASAAGIYDYTGGAAGVTTGLRWRLQVVL
jgi:hypothetical protein